MQRIFLSIKYLFVKLCCNSEDATDFLSHASTRATYKHWELKEEVFEFMEYELEHLDEAQHAQLLDLVHAAAYRNTLCHSLYSPLHQVWSFDPPFLHRLIRELWTSDRSSLVGVGVEHERLLELCSRFDWGRDASQERHIDAHIYYENEHEPSAAPWEKYDFHEVPVYKGGERRLLTGDPIVHAALVSESAGYRAGFSIFSYVII